MELIFGFTAAGGWPKASRRSTTHRAIDRLADHRELPRICKIDVANVYGLAYSVVIIPCQRRPAARTYKAVA